MAAFARPSASCPRGNAAWRRLPARSATESVFGARPAGQTTPASAAANKNFHASFFMGAAPRFEIAPSGVERRDLDWPVRLLRIDDDRFAWLNINQFVFDLLLRFQ